MDGIAGFERGVVLSYPVVADRQSDGKNASRSYWLGLGGERMKRAILRYVGDLRIRELLRAHDCPTSFHAVRTRFLGNIATPRLDASPIQVIQELWGGEFPEFEDTGHANALFQGLMSF